MAGNDHPDFSKPVMVGCILGLPDAENHLDSILGKLEPFCTAGTLGLGPLGYRIDVCDPNPLCLSRISRLVRRFHRSPALGIDPAAYLRCTYLRCIGTGRK